jgi:hypothetical protein
MPTLRLILVRLSPRVFSTGTSRDKSALERQGRPNSASYIMQAKEANVSSIELGMQNRRHIEGDYEPSGFKTTRTLPLDQPDRAHVAESGRQHRLQ